MPPLPSLRDILPAGTIITPVRMPGGLPPRHDILINDFVRRQTADSKHSHWILSDDDLLERIEEAWSQQRPGYRDGVVLVPVNPQGFYTSIVTLQEGDKLIGQFKRRKDGEDPRKSTIKDRGDTPLEELKQPAVLVDIILYRDDVLAEDNEQTGHEWNIISINAYPTNEIAPIHPDVLIANHFHLSGGTATGMTPEQFETQMRESVLYWKDKAMVG